MHVLYYIILYIYIYLYICIFRPTLNKLIIIGLPGLKDLFALEVLYTALTNGHHLFFKFYRTKSLALYSTPHL